MRLYVVNLSSRETDIIEDYISVIWTTRYNDPGEIEVKIPYASSGRLLLGPGAMLAIDGSPEIMIITSREETDDPEEGHIVTYKGITYDAWFYQRKIVWGGPDWKLDQPLVVKNKPSAVINYCHDVAAIWTTMSPYNRGKGLSGPFENEVGKFNVAEDTAVIDYTIEEPIPLLDVFTDLCKSYDYGFQISRYKGYTSPKWRIHNGKDRTSSQTTYPPVLFSSQLDNMQNTRTLVDTTNEYTVAFVATPVGNMFVTPDFVDPGISGADRKTLPVIAKDITTTDKAEAERLMRIRGLQELAKHQVYRGVDGEVSQFSPYKYGVDYEIGDIVELRDNNGYVNRARITEFIWSSDREGDKEYPTLSAQTLAIPGSWLLWKSDKVWADMTTEEWAKI